MIKKILNTIVKVIEVFIVLVFIIFEELIWKTLGVPIKNFFNKLEFLDKFKKMVQTSSGYGSLGIFLIPFAVAEYLGIYSLSLMLTGSVFIGVLVYILKVPVAAIAFWLFAILKPKLLAIGWFKGLYELVMKAFNWAKNRSIYKEVMAMVRLYRMKVKSYIMKFKTKDGFLTEMGTIYDAVRKIFIEDKESNGAKK